MTARTRGSRPIRRFGPSSARSTRQPADGRSRQGRLWRASSSRGGGDRIDRRIWQNEGSEACLTIWASAFWDGKKPHRRVLRRARRVQRRRGIQGPGDRPTSRDQDVRSTAVDVRRVWRRSYSVWGEERAITTTPVFGFRRSTKGSTWGNRDPHRPILRFDPNAPTPKSAWQTIGPANPSFGIGYGSFCMMTDNEMYFASNTVGKNGVLDLRTGLVGPEPLSVGPVQGDQQCQLHVHAPGLDRIDEQGLAHGPQRHNSDQPLPCSLLRSADRNILDAQRRQCLSGLVASWFGDNIEHRARDPLVRRASHWLSGHLRL